MDTRPRCTNDGKVILDESRANKAAIAIRERKPFAGDERMQAYLGMCGNWHVGHGKRKKQ